MKIYKTKSGDFWFAQAKGNGWFCFSSTPPDINTLNLCPGMFGYDEEKTAWDEAIDIPLHIEVSVFNKFARKTNNFKDVYEFYNDWGTSLDNIITESIEFYPEQNDFDKRYYYVKDKLSQLRIKDIEDFKKRHKKQ